MAYLTGTATDHNDLYDTLITFLTTDSALVTANQEWEVMGTLSEYTKGHALKGQGLGGTDEIFVNTWMYEDVPSDIYNIYFRGAFAYDSLSTAANQPGASDQKPHLIWSGSMKYWFFANGRRFIVVTNSNGYMHSSYNGFFLPTGPDSEYPYPLVIAASHDAASRYNSASVEVRGFYDPARYGGFTYVTPGNDWFSINNKYSSSGRTYTLRDANCWPWNNDNMAIHTIDGERVLIQSMLHTNELGGNVWGFLDGVFYVNGFNGISPEDTITVGGDTYLVINSTYRLGANDFAAIKIEA